MEIGLKIRWTKITRRVKYTSSFYNKNIQLDNFYVII